LILYLAGNFTLLNNVDRERKFKESIEKRGKEYHRLVTFFYPRNVKTAITIVKEEAECQGKLKQTSSKPKRSRKG
jgi:hypothetical protein